VAPLVAMTKIAHDRIASSNQSATPLADMAANTSLARMLSPYDIADMALSSARRWRATFRGRRYRFAATR
jgi:glucose-6-phosphate dehydrogenase assembly protein OpcA